MTASSGAQGDGEDERKATEQEEGSDLTDGVVESEGGQRAPGRNTRFSGAAPTSRGMVL